MRDGLEATLPREHYLDSAVFEREFEATYRRGWVCVGHASALPNAGDYLALRLHTQSVVVVRNESGTLSAFFNVCRHRGAELVALVDATPRMGHFSRHITCPYHAWHYHLTGQLKGTPHLEIATDGIALHPIRLADWGGFIFLCLSPDETESLEEALGEGALRIANYPLADLKVGATLHYTVDANWKVILENYNECYHCGPVHPELCQIVPAFRQGGGAALNWEDGIPHREGAVTFTASGQTARAPFPGLSETEKTHHKGELFYPNLMLSLSMDHAAAFYVWPESVQRTRIQCDFLFHPSELGKTDFDASDAVTFWDLVNQQDWRICESVQRGMQNLVFEHGYYAPMEDFSLDIRHYITRKLERLNG